MKGYLKFIEVCPYNHHSKQIKTYKKNYKSSSTKLKEVKVVRKSRWKQKVTKEVNIRHKQSKEFDKS